eukprot:scaffold133423_cov38-Attheya_sp.AAC.1
MDRGVVLLVCRCFRRDERKCNGRVQGAEVVEDEGGECFRGGEVIHGDFWFEVRQEGDQIGCQGESVRGVCRGRFKDDRVDDGHDYFGSWFVF